MQRFTLIHDGSDQGWQAAYLAFHIAARLGAPLLALLVDASTDKKILAQRASQVEVGGRAADLAIETRLVTGFSVDMLKEKTANSDGLFIPLRLISDEKNGLHFLETLSCPLWIVSRETATYEMAILVDNLAVNKKLISSTTALAFRLQQSLTGLVGENELSLASHTESSIAWLPLSNFSPIEINAALNQLHTGLLFLLASNLPLTYELSVNCVVYPTIWDA